MKKGVFSKLVITFVGIIALSFVIVATFLSLWFERYYFDQRKGQLFAESQYIEKYAIGYLGAEVSSSQLKDLLNSISHYLSADIWIADQYGYVYAAPDNREKSNIIGSQIVTTELEELRLGRYVEKKGEYANGTPAYVNTLCVPIFFRGSFEGAVIFHTSIAEIKGPLNNVYRIIWFSAILAIVVSCIVIYYFSQKIIIKPLAQINYVADKLSKGEVERRVNTNSDDEIGELAKSFNSMADSLEQVEKMRREFISNVSHEIRSPITSIKGFIGGIIDGVIPKEKEEYYLSVAYTETQRLTRLVNDLLDLSAIEAGQFRLRIEEVDINEIIRLCVIKFETNIKTKKLNVDVLLDDDKVFVAADRDRLIQVVTNLIDNAIKYVHEGGNVKVSTKVKGEKVVVNIFNDGPNIPEPDIKHIWDRFYKVDKSRSSKVSTGLGLPIVRSILTQLGEDIWVENKEPSGVEFTFTLRRV